jgi:hypothetical protein
MRNEIGNFIIRGKDLNIGVFSEKVLNISMEACTEYCVKVYGFNACVNLNYSNLDVSKSDLVCQKLFMFLDYKGLYDRGNTVELLFYNLFGNNPSNRLGYYLDVETGLVYHNIYIIRILEL